MKTKVLTREEAIQLAKQKFPGKCCFVGNLNEVWEHAEKEHNVKGTMKIERLDGAKYVEDCWDGDEGHWTNTKEILVNESGEFWYVCLEDHKHIWKKLTPQQKEEMKKYTLFKHDMYCVICWEGAYNDYYKGEEEMNEQEFQTLKKWFELRKKDKKIGVCAICGETFKDITDVLIHLKEVHGCDV